MRPTIYTRAHTVDEDRGSGRRYASQEDVAQYLGVSATTIRRWVASGKLTVYRFGERIIRLDLNEIDAKMTPTVAAHGGDRNVAG